MITPLADSFELFGDNRPSFETQEARISVFSMNNYTALVRAIVSALLSADFTVTARRYIGREDDTGYFHYALDLSKLYCWEG